MNTPHTADTTPAIATTEPETPKQNQKNNTAATATAAISSTPTMASTAMCTGQLVTQSSVPATATLSADMQRLRDAIAAIPAVASLGKHSAEQAIGMALRHVTSGIDTDVGRSLCTEWDALTGGQSVSVFNASDPNYSATAPLGLASIFSLARSHGWVDALPWPTLQALVEPTPRLDYPLEALPDAVRCAVQEVAGFVKAPIPLIATSALSAMSLAIQAHTDVQRAEKLAGPCSLFMLAIAESGERKSSCDGYFTKPIRDHETKAQEAAKPLIAAYESDLEAWEAQRSGIKDAIKQLAKNGNPAATLAQQLHALDASKPIPPRVPKLIYSDATPEALTYSLAKQWPSGGVISSEAGSVFGGHGMGTESVMRNLATLNQLWDGATLPVERRSSESFTVRGARLTMALQVQESTIRAFFANTKGLARGTGFLARFLVSWPESTQGTRHFTEAPANWPSLAAFHERLTDILNQPAPMDTEGALTPAMLTLAPDAKAAWVKFHDDIESELATGGELSDVRDVASKTADNAVRLAALFHTFSGSTGPIDLKAMASASLVAAWHLYEARRFLGEMAMPAELANAGRLEAWMLDYCKREQTDHVPTRVIQQRISPICLRNKTTFTEALNELAELGRARLVQDGKKRTVQIRPELLAVTV
jgi:putative DNA primase/helicase